MGPLRYLQRYYSLNQSGSVFWVLLLAHNMEISVVPMLKQFVEVWKASDYMWGGSLRMNCRPCVPHCWDTEQMSIADEPLLHHPVLVFPDVVTQRPPTCAHITQLWHVTLAPTVTNINKLCRLQALFLPVFSLLTEFWSEVGSSSCSISNDRKHTVDQASTWENIE